MTFVLAAVALVAAGLAVLDLLRLRTGALAADLAAAWFAGTGWFGLGAMGLRLAAGIPFRVATAAALVATPVAAALAERALRRRLPAPEPAPAAPAAARWLPRPAWLFGPAAAFVLAVAAGATLHGLNTPTNTDDGVRVRAYTPMLAFDDAWNPAARELLAMAGPVTTWPPALAWRTAGTVDPFHVNGFVVATFLALLALAVALPSARGRPEQGWASAALVTSLPLFVYHATSTYSDGVLAAYLGAGFLFALEYGRTADLDDAARAALLLGVACLVKREGMVVAGAVAAVLLAEAAWRCRRAPRRALRPALLAALPVAIGIAASAAALGVGEALPIVKVLAGGSPAAPAAPGAAAGVGLDEALPAYAFALFHSGNAGMTFWILPAAALLGAPALRRAGHGWALAAVGILLAEVTVSSLWLLPQFTVNGTTVHRALLSASVPAMLWLGGFLVDAAPAERGAPAPPGAGQGKRRRGKRAS